MNCCAPDCSNQAPERVRGDDDSNHAPPDREVLSQISVIAESPENTIEVLITKDVADPEKTAETVEPNGNSCEQEKWSETKAKEQPADFTTVAVQPELEDLPEPTKVDTADSTANGKAGSQIAEGDLSWNMIMLSLGVGICSFFLFLVGLTLLGSSFKAMAGENASSLFGAVQDPIAGLMVGVIATVLIQSSSTSSSIVVALVSVDAVEVKNAIPIIMGANIGTSVTNTLVSMGQSGNRINLERSFAGATVHDMFNMLTVLTLLPLEWICSAIQGTGGPLYWLTYAITNALMGGDGGSSLFKSPIKRITSPVAELFLKSNKYIIYAKTLDRPEPKTPSSICNVCQAMEGVIRSNCTRRRLEDANVGDAFSRSLLNKRRLEEASKQEALKDVDCSDYGCVTPALASNFKKANKAAYAKLVKCGDALPNSLCGEAPCYLGASKYYDVEVTDGRIIAKGFLKVAGDEGGGIIGLIISLTFMTMGLIGLCKSLQTLFLGKAKAVIKYSAKMNGYFAILVGFAMTIVVQSSSVVTSALTPLCGLGVLPLKKMLPMTLGSNIGTTATALIAACVDLKFAGVQIALVHFFFNLLGILIWFPTPFLRRIPLAAAQLLGQYASYYRFVTLLYILVAFLIMPGICLCVALAFYASVALGAVLLAALIVILTAFEFWWWRGFGSGPGAFKVLSEEARQKGHKELMESSASVVGVSVDEYEREVNSLTWSGN